MELAVGELANQEITDSAAFENNPCCITSSPPTNSSQGL